MALVADVWRKNLHHVRWTNSGLLGDYCKPDNPLYWLVRATPSGEARQENVRIRKLKGVPHVSLVSLSSLVTEARLRRAVVIHIALHADIAAKFSLDDWMILLSYTAGATLIFIQEKPQPLPPRAYLEGLLVDALKKQKKNTGPELTTS
jgi:hypothetical protein